MTAPCEIVGRARRFLLRDLWRMDLVGSSLATAPIRFLQFGYVVVEGFIRDELLLRAFVDERATYDADGRFVWWLDFKKLDKAAIKAETVTNHLRSMVWYSHAMMYDEKAQANGMVIVEDAARGKGVGRLLNEAAIAHAFDEGAITIDLTSRPSREAANRLYQRIGFVQRETNVYRYSKPDQLES